MSACKIENGSDDFQNQSSSFLEWFQSRSDSRLSAKITVADLRSRDAGRGVLAVSNITADEELFAVPRSMVLQKTNSHLYLKLPQAFADLGPWDSLIIVLVYEYLRHDSSPWFPYLQLLPTSFDTLMFWTPAELSELQGSAVVNKIGKEAAQENWNRTLLPTMFNNGALFPLSTRSPQDRVGELLKLAHMAGSMIMAYAFDIEADDSDDPEEDPAEGADSDLTDDDEENPAKGMVPFADLLNADAHRNNARLFHEDDFLIMRATQDIDAGHEIFNDYGPLPRSDLLRMYGYMTDNYSAHDVVEVSADLIENVAASSGSDRLYLAQQRAELERLGLIDDAFVFNRPKADAKLEDIIPVDLRMLTAALCRPAEEFHSLKPSQHVKGSSIALSEASLLLTSITNRLGDYRTSLREDLEILEKLKTKDHHLVPAGISRKRYEMAVQVRKGEKEILHQVLQLLRDFVDRQTRQMAGDSTKRKRDEKDPAAVSKKSSTRK